MAGEEAPIAIDVAGLGALEAAPALPKKPSMLAIVAELVILTCFAIGAGGLFGMQMLGGNDAGAPKHEAAAAKTQKGKYSEGSNLKALPVIVTNLAGRKGHVDPHRGIVCPRRRRSERECAGRDRSAKTSSPTCARCRVDQLEGPSGFLHLREDLNDRARIRSGGKVRELVIQGLVLE